MGSPHKRWKPVFFQENRFLIQTPRYVPPRERPCRGLAFTEQVGSIGDEVAVAINASRRPGDLDEFGTPGPAQSDIDPGIGRRQVAAAAEPGDDLPAPEGGDGDAGSDGVAVRRGAFEPHREGMSSVGHVVKQDQGLVRRDEQRVRPPVIVEVADRQASAQVECLKGRPSPVRNVG